jgi:hypothetical protein
MRAAPEMVSGSVSTHSSEVTMVTSTHKSTEVTLGRATFSKTVETWFEVVAATAEGRIATYELVHRETGIRGVVTVTPKMRGLGGKFE